MQLFTRRIKRRSICLKCTENSVFIRNIKHVIYNLFIVKDAFKRTFF